MNSKKDEPLLSMWKQMSTGSDSEVQTSVIGKILSMFGTIWVYNSNFPLKKI